MRLAILITNTDFSAFAQARPDDGEKFRALIHSVRPDWECEPFWVCKGDFPEDLFGFDGAMITGSPASVRDGADWMLRLADLIRDAAARKFPLFGACFGHQIIALALGGALGRNPDGWGHGLLHVARAGQAPWTGAESGFALYGSHIEQVVRAPEKARIMFKGPGCDIAGFAMGDQIFTIQHHPEMTHDFIADLVEEYADYVGEEVTQSARTSLANMADTIPFAHEIARFFDHATQTVPATGSTANQEAM